MIDLLHPDKRNVCGEFCEVLRERQYAEVPFALSQEDFNKAAEHFFDFLALPQEEKERFYVRPTDDPRDSGVGYVRKLQMMGERDDKEYFHYHPSLEERYATDLCVGDDPVVRQFFDSARTVFSTAEEVIGHIARALEYQHPGLVDRLLPLEVEWGTVLRFLKYDVAGKGKFLAKGHYDMGACTLALAESAPGLRLGRDNETLTPVSRSGNTAFFMMGLNFTPLTENAFMPTWHDVVQASDDTWNEETARWAIVFFVGARGLPLPSYEATGTPIA